MSEGIKKALEESGFVKTGNQWTRKTLTETGTLEDVWNEGDDRVLRFYTPSTPSPTWVYLADVISDDPRQLRLFK